MRKTSCQAVLNRKVVRKAPRSLEGHDEYGKPIYRCIGYTQLMNDEELPECKDCKKYIRYEYYH